MRKKSFSVFIVSFALGVIFFLEAINAASNKPNREREAQENISRCWCHGASLVELPHEKEMEAQETIKAAAHTAEALENLTLRSFALSRIASGLTEVNQAEASQLIDQALVEASHIYSPSSQNYVAKLEDTIKSWKEKEQEKILPIITRIENVRSRAWLLRAIAATTVGINKTKAEKIFEEAIEKAETIENQQYRDYDLRSIASEMAKLSTTRAIQIARGIRDPRIKAWALRSIASEVVQYDPPGALKIWQMAIAEVEKMREPTLSDIEREKKMPSLSVEVKQRLLLSRKAKRTAAKTQILNRIGLEINRVDKEIATSLFNRILQMAENIETPYTKSYTLSDITGVLAQIDIDAASRVSGMIGKQYADARFSALMAIASITSAQEDLEKAAAAAEEIGEAYDRAKALSRIAAAMSQLNRDKALKLINKIEYPYLYSKALSSIAIKPSWNDEREVLELVSHIKDPFIRSKTLKEIAALMSRKDKKKAEKLFVKATSIAEDIKSTHLLWDIVADWTRIDKDKFFDMAGKTEGNQHHRAMALRRIALDWSKSDVSKAEMVLDMAVKLIEKSDDAYIRSELLRQTAVDWAKVDKVKAGAIFRKAMEAAKAIGKG